MSIVCNLTGKSAGEGKQNRPRVFNLRRRLVKNKGKIGLFYFSHLWSTQIVVLNIFLFFVCPSSSQQPRKLFLGRKNIGRVFAHPLLHPQIYACAVERGPFTKYIWYFLVFEVNDIIGSLIMRGIERNLLSIHVTIHYSG